MGIPRLSQDLQPYADRVALGQSTLSTNAPNIDHLVVDGPSLVYLIYNRLLAYRASRSPVLNGGLPRYSEVNQGLHYFLGDLGERGVQIHQIFFDGGLPASKRPVRLDRMEKIRGQLEIYRARHPLDPMVAPIGDIDFEEALWMSPAISSGKSLPPPPPFMVASAIESLRGSQWRGLVSVVPGEADSFCAQAACEISAAVLTNDSDLAVHDLGPNGSLTLLGSIERKANTQSQNSTSLTILSLRPRHVSERLGVPSLLRFGFERYLDPSLSTAIVCQRSKDGSRLESLRSDYDEFAEQYLAPQVGVKTMPRINDIDPRTAELIVSSPDSPSVYLTPILEDPSRDSSWSYGADYRVLAFSIMASSTPGSNRKTMTEFARRGQRITSTTVSQLSETKIGEHLHQAINSLRRFLPANTTDPSTTRTCSIILNWYVFAAQQVQHHKLNLGKQPPTPSLIQSTLGLMSGQSNNKARASWDEVHFLANMHAVLYSLRMLHQISEYVLRGLERRHTQPHDDRSKPQDNKAPAETLLRDLTAMLSTMPKIEDLFLDVADLRSRIRELDVEVRNAAIDRLVSPVDDGADDDDHRLIDSENPATLKSHKKHAPPDRITLETEKHWLTAKRKRKRARNPTSGVRNPSINNTSNKNIGRVRNGGGNSFDALRTTATD